MRSVGRYTQALFSSGRRKRGWARVRASAWIRQALFGRTVWVHKKSGCNKSYDLRVCG